MQFDLASVLPHLLPRAIDWVEAKSSEILDNGSPLSDPGIQLAQKVGVGKPELIRVSIVPELPLPEDPELRETVIHTGLLGPGMVGITFGYGIYICDEHFTHRLLSHECRHVFQYETAGSIKDFLPLYLQQIAEYGYCDAPYEIDAREHEIHAA